MAAVDPRRADGQDGEHGRRGQQLQQRVEHRAHRGHPQLGGPQPLDGDGEPGVLHGAEAEAADHRVALDRLVRHPADRAPGRLCLPGAWCEQSLVQDVEREDQHHEDQPDQAQDEVADEEFGEREQQHEHLAEREVRELHR
ncbi:hypothetical protein GCM10027610_027520 [Dactylosporangium cerinum]